MAESILNVELDMVRLFLEEDLLIYKYIYISAVHLVYSIPASSWFIAHSVEHCITIVEVLSEPC